MVQQGCRSSGQNIDLADISINDIALYLLANSKSNGGCEPPSSVIMLVMTDKDNLDLAEPPSRQKKTIVFRINQGLLVDNAILRLSPF
ncbi:uncharacterized protein PHALS_06643 [Plasmopara halstedii]|uniref:Uncharacterized protein n=1 Tax=Plasmopara halstedii TaxID=4781 RepID=A0A0P1B2A5_PLAHL|nr:uncharacterized protein PHALS_06643 [Plasmopara halstedii]CEG48845.1 hypothetical protein PHALS_06643 [Plasmopara halstedii]|eukprot:XP_024585214.1 hypothetical protein PHALS_06643 [Plasmopara halstedii]